MVHKRWMVLDFLSVHAKPVTARQLANEIGRRYKRQSWTVNGVSACLTRLRIMGLVEMTPVTDRALWRVSDPLTVDEARDERGRIRPEVLLTASKRSV